MENSLLRGIRFKNVSFRYPGQNPLFKDFSLHLQLTSERQGHIVALMGASGIGKSTFLNLILGSVKPVSGALEIIPANAVISYIPQEPVLFDHMTPLQNATYFSTTSAYRHLFDIEFFTRMSISLSMHKILREARSIKQLSGGQQQRLMLLRAMSIKPHILLLDEPTTGLDSTAKLKFMYLLREIIVKHNLLAVYCTHHMKESLLIAEEVLYMSNTEETHNRVLRQPITSFAEQPLTMEALQALRFPNPNLVFCKLDEQGLVLPASKDDQDGFYICVDENNLLFDHEKGLAYSVVFENPLYSLITVGGQSLSLSSSLLPGTERPRLLINGTLLRYDQHQLASGKIRIKNGYAV